MSTSTDKRLASAFQKNCYDRHHDKSINSCSERHLSDTGQKDRENQDVNNPNIEKHLTSTNYKTMGITEATKIEKAEFVKAAIELVLENAQLTRKVLESIKAQQNVQKHP